ncbi:hypothetical protein MUK42_37101 [Musa troglodytarum]|uniref:Uncharacterized protein n=1 Tax=Musa troglodytarum TaxID=320322 RepID=A0A9E7EFI9_9LILI|nr:hypothetical protein MUK42_37101 [Musa troglodytarum]
MSLGLKDFPCRVRVASTSLIGLPYLSCLVANPIWVRAALIRVLLGLGLRARGKSGLLFHYNVHEDVRTIADATIEKDEIPSGVIAGIQQGNQRKGVIMWRKKQLSNLQATPLQSDRLARLCIFFSFSISILRFLANLDATLLSALCICICSSHPDCHAAVVSPGGRTPASVGWRTNAGGDG